MRSGSTKITLSYLEPSTGRTLRAHTTITSYKPLELGMISNKKSIVTIFGHKHLSKK